MKILIVSGVQTRPVTSGSGKFISEYCKMLQSMGHEVFFLHVTFFAFNSQYEAILNEGIQATKLQWGDHYFRYKFSFLDKVKMELLGLFRKLFSNWFAKVDDRYPIGLSYFVNSLHNKYSFDACLVNYYWFSKLLTKIAIPKKGIITHDSFTFNNLRNNIQSLLNLTPTEEARALQRCPYIFAMQEEERILFERYSPKSKVLTSFCNYDYRETPITNNHNIVYLSGGFHLNVNGLKWFIDNVFPGILSVWSDCKLIIAGTICKEIMDYNNHPSVELLGMVDDAYELYRLGDIAINPTYQGTGLKIKTFESIAFGKIVMVHPHSVNGIWESSNAPLFSSSNPSDWVGFLNSVWNSTTDIIQSFKNKDKQYIEKLNSFIRSQFSEFLS